MKKFKSFRIMSLIVHDYEIVKGKAMKININLWYNLSSFLKCFMARENLQRQTPKCRTKSQFLETKKKSFYFFGSKRKAEAKAQKMFSN